MPERTPLEEWFFDIPVVTRCYVTAVFLTTLACVKKKEKPKKEREKERVDLEWEVEDRC